MYCGRNDLISHGLKKVLVIIRDDFSGLKENIKEIFLRFGKELARHKILNNHLHYSLANFAFFIPIYSKVIEIAVTEAGLNV